MSLEHDVDFLMRENKRIRARLIELSMLLDVIASPPWKRLWWFLCGYRLWKVGRWLGDETISSQH